MKDYVIDVLMNIGVPAGIKGFTYICDAIELFNTDPYYPDGKISALYIDIAKKYHTTPSRMEAMKTLSEEIESLFNRTLASVRDDIHPTDDGQSERSCSGFPKSLKS